MCRGGGERPLPCNLGVQKSSLKGIPVDFNSHVMYWRS